MRGAKAKLTRGFTISYYPAISGDRPHEDVYAREARGREAVLYSRSPEPVTPVTHLSLGYHGGITHVSIAPTGLQQGGIAGNTGPTVAEGDKGPFWR